VLAFGTVAALTLVGCQANPGDAPTVEDPSAASSAAPRSTTRGAVPDELRTVTAGVDTVPADSNPHLIGSQSLATSVIAALTLPSAFTAREGGRTDLNTDLLDAAEVTVGDRDAPTAVRYRISGAAQWSDGTPVTGSDFEYLHDQITTQPGVLDQALYASVKDLSVSAGGRTVDVTFTAPQPDWHDLFADLLPSHIYRAENRPFATMMEGKPAASAGQYAVRGFDAGRGTVQLARNDRFWGDTPARTDSIVLTVVPDDATAAQMLRTGQLQLVATRRGAVTGESLGSVPGVTTRTTGRRTDLTLALNTTSPLLAGASRRAEVLAAVDAGAVARTVSGSPDATAPAPLPSAGPDRSTEPTGGAAPESPETGDAPLRIGAEESDRSAVEAARRVVDQLVRGHPRPGRHPGRRGPLRDLPAAGRGRCRRGLAGRGRDPRRRAQPLRLRSRRPAGRGPGHPAAVVGGASHRTVHLVGCVFVVFVVFADRDEIHRADHHGTGHRGNVGADRPRATGTGRRRARIEPQRPVRSGDRRAAGRCRRRHGPRRCHRPGHDRPGPGTGGRIRRRTAADG
jgi:hypothetical protein